jgi:hypothetical protein
MLALALLASNQNLMKCVSERSRVLIDTCFEKRYHDLLIKIRDVKSEANGRGVLNSSMCVNEICRVCVEEYQAMSESIYNDLVRAHESCGTPLPENATEEMVNIFEKLESEIKGKIEGAQEQAAGGIANGLQNKGLLEFNRIPKENDRVKAKYKTEIEMYIDGVRQQSVKIATDQIKDKFLNNRIIAFGVIVIAVVVAIGAFTGAIESISAAVSSVFN